MSVALSLRTTTAGLLTFCVLAFPAGAVGSFSGGAHTSVGFEPIPLSLAADAAGHVYLSNPQDGEDSIQQYSSDGELLGSRGDFAKAAPPYQRDIATDAAGNLYVADSGRDEIVVFGPDGATLRRWSARGRDLAVDATGTVYLADSHEIQRFGVDGALLSKWGASGEGDGQFGEVWGLDASPSGLVYVADTYRNRIQVFNADGSFVGRWGSFGHGAGQLVYPYGIATDAAGNVYVADTGNARVQKFSASGAFLGAWGGPGRGPGRFFTPTAVATDPAGYVYVADAGEPYPPVWPGSARVQKFTADGALVTQWRVLSSRPPAPPRLFGNVGRRTTKRFAVFRFSSEQEGVHFSCRLSGVLVPAKLRRWRACSSPQRYAHLRPGRKVFHVRGISEPWAGEEARRSWLIIRG